MTKKPLLSVFFVVLTLGLPGVAASQKANVQSHSVSQAAGAQTAVSAKKNSPGDANLPQSASALPLLSAVGAGALLGGLLSARRTRSDK